MGKRDRPDLTDEPGAFSATWVDDSVPREEYRASRDEIEQIARDAIGDSDLDVQLYDVYVNEGVAGEEPRRGTLLEEVPARDVREAVITAFGKHMDEVPPNLFSAVVVDDEGTEQTYEMSVGDMKNVRQVAFENGAKRWIAWPPHEPLAGKQLVAFEPETIAASWFHANPDGEEVVVTRVDEDDNVLRPDGTSASVLTEAEEHRVHIEDFGTDE